MTSKRILTSILLLFTSPALWTSFADSLSAQDTSAQDTQTIDPLVDWQQLETLPDRIGFGGPYVGISGGALIVAGGANFPHGPIWDGHPKVWHGHAFVMTSPGASWQRLETELSIPLGYGVSITTEDGIICIGGCDDQRCYPDVFVLKWSLSQNRLIQTKTLVSDKAQARDAVQLPDLPVPLAFMSGAKIGNYLYVAGGQEKMGESVPATKNFWRLDLTKNSDQDDLRWEKMPWPEDAPARVLAVAASQSDGREDRFYLFSGRDVGPGKATTYLTDSWCFSSQQKRWKRVADVPRSITAGSAVAIGASHVLTIGGDDGSLGQDLEDQHPGFPRDLFYAYHTITDTWVQAGKLPVNQVTTVAVKWNDQDGNPMIVIPSGEIRPSVRTPNVNAITLSAAKSGFRSLDYGVVAAYLLILVAMGIYFSRREKSTTDFFLGGHRIPWWAAGLSIFGTQLSAITFMAIPAMSFRTDWIYFLGDLMIVAIAPIVVWYYLPFFRQLQVTTAYEYLEKRFNVVVRLIGSASFILLQLGRMGVVLVLPALALSAVTGLNVYICIALMGVLATIYTVLGGIEAVVWTDVLQVIVLLGGALLVCIVIVTRVEGGIGHLVALSSAENKLKMVNLSWSVTTTALWVVIVGWLLENLIPYTADQTVVQRYLITPDQKQAANSIWTNAILTIPGSLLFFAVGTALWVYYKTYPEKLGLLERHDQILPWFIVHELPAGVSGLVIAAIFAASMSSLDSSMNSMAAAITTDFYRRFKPDSSDQFCLKLARWLTLLLGVVGTGFAFQMALYNDASMWDRFIKFFGLFGGGLAGLFAVGIFTCRTHGAGAVVGFTTSALVLYFVSSSGAVHFFLYAGIGIITCFVVSYMASLVIPAEQKSLAKLTVYTTDEVSG